MIWREDGLIDEEEEEEEVVCVCAKPRGRIWADMPGKRSQVGKDEGKKVMENQVRWRGRNHRCRRGNLVGAPVSSYGRL